jgi:hypothetical protein
MYVPDRYRLSTILTAPFKRQHPELVDGILNSIQNIGDEVTSVLADPEVSRDCLLSKLSVTTFVAVHPPCLTVNSLL